MRRPAEEPPICCQFLTKKDRSFAKTGSGHTHQEELKTVAFVSAGGMALYNALGGAGQGADSTRLKLPIPQIVGTMFALMLCCAIGVTANAKLTPEKKAKVEKVLKIVLVPALIVGTVGFFVTDGCALL